MKRTQIQLPEPLFNEIRQIAKRLDWSVTEVIRRGAEYMTQVYAKEISNSDWVLPNAEPLGDFKAPVQKWRQIANEPELASFLHKGRNKPL
ncbi:MAG: antitoxin [Deltaproteobacteria bacterium]|nr:antitoxin [Deltaproteobacteria bacterium]